MPAVDRRHRVLGRQASREGGNRGTGLRHDRSCLVYLVCLVIGIVLDLVQPMALLTDAVQYPIGGFLIVVSFIPVPFILTRFKQTGTSFDSRGPTTSLLRDGPYRYSRNPAHLSMTLLFIGFGVLIDSLWVLIFLASGFAVMNFVVVAREEAHLEQQFGDEYRAYKASVRRWI